MYTTKYGSYSPTSIHSTKESIHKQIYFLLLCVDPATRDQFENIDVEDAFHNLQYRLNGLQNILLCPLELIETMSLLEAALIEYQSDCFNWKVFRKLMLDAGSEIMRMREGDSDGN